MSEPKDTTILTREQVAKARGFKAYTDGIGGEDYPTIEMSPATRDALCDSHEALRAEVDKLRDTVRHLTKERDEAQAAENAADARAGYALCGCMADRPGDVCVSHSPAVARLQAEVEALKGERDQIEQKYRAMLWRYHGHAGAALYGDDGEMQCSACVPITGLYDYQREPLEKVEAAAFKAALSVQYPTPTEAR